MSVTAVPIRPLNRGSVLKLWIGLVLLALAAGALAGSARPRRGHHRGVGLRHGNRGRGPD
jgi:hypothetical protein